MASQPVVTIGNFDGVHKGHAALLAAARDVAATEKRELVALTFEPHPKTFFQPDAPAFRITPDALKERRLRALGVSRVDVLDFNGIMASLTAQQFIDFILVDHLNAAHIVIGDDFHFGKNRLGNLATLRADKRFLTTGLSLVHDGETPVSSTRIREALRAGDIAAADAMLGWEWEIEGTVVHGDKRGRELGYPTANIPLGDTIAPAYGIYACRVLIDGIWHAAAANIGIRPMFELSEPLLEVYVLDYHGDLYDRDLRVRPVRRLRGEMKFDSLDALKARMAQDCAEARNILNAAT